MVHHHLAVLGTPDVKFEIYEPGINRILEGGRGILRKGGTASMPEKPGFDGRKKSEFIVPSPPTFALP